MDNAESKRNINIDIIKCLAVFFVIAVHFILNIGFYSVPINNITMYIMVVVRTFLMVCVPLFLLITGYLMNKKEFSASHYIGIKKVIIPYIIISLITLLAKLFLTKYGIFEVSDSYKYIKDFLDFKLIEYAWYVDMYIGLYLLIPFINKMLTGNKFQDSILLLILSFLTILPNISQNPTLIVSEWSSIWFLTYYMIGAYINRYKIKMSNHILVPLFLFFVLYFSVISISLFHGICWRKNIFDSWGGLEHAVTSILFFMIFLNIDFNCLSEKFKNCISNVAKLSLGIYLSSYLFDRIIYHYLNINIADITLRLKWFFVIPPVVFMCSLTLAIIVDKMSKLVGANKIN